MKNQKLELTWIGKDKKIKVEPRILIEDKEKSYGDENSENMLIHGDNLLALKAIEDKYTNKIQCIYIDPPYNTGSAFEHYDDNMEHSIWLNLMKSRLEILKKLLTKSGSIYIQIDDVEYAYLKIMCDEIFGRENFISTIVVKMSTSSGVKTAHKEKTILKIKEYILVYAKDKECIEFNPLYVPVQEIDSEFQYFLDKKGDNIENWSVKRLNDVLIDKGFDIKKDKKEILKFIQENSDKVWRRAFIRNEYKELSQKEPNKIFYNKSNGKEHYYYRGREMFFLKDKFHKCLTEAGYIETQSNLLGDFWEDINTGKLFNEGNVDFRNGKKPEFLIARILELSTKEGDIVLDSFLGSGTTCAVAHKMNRKWIGIELGEHCYTHCIPRLSSVINGTDNAGMTKAFNWTGGGGYKFYELAPSLLVKDKFDNWVISENYNGELLTRAICKQEKFEYSPEDNYYWKQGKSSENDYIYVTTNYISLEYLQAIRDEMQDNESLLICCKSYQEECKDKYDNITIKKIPQSILNNCEYSRDDYSLNVEEILEVDEDE